MVIGPDVLAWWPVHGRIRNLPPLPGQTGRPLAGAWRERPARPFLLLGHEPGKDRRGHGGAADFGPDHEFDAGLVAVACRKVERIRMLEWEMTGVYPSDTDPDPDPDIG